MTLNRIKSILFVTYHFPPEVGGIQTRISEYVKQLGIMGINVRVIFLTAERDAFREYSMGKAKVFVRSGHMRYFISNFRCLIAAATSSEADVIHVFSGATTVFSFASLVLARIMMRQPVFSFFGTEGVLFDSFTEKAFFELSATVAGKIATNTSAMKTLVPKRFQRKTRLLYGGAAVLNVDKEEDQFNNTIEILFVGRLVASKGVDDLLSAFAIVRQTIPQARLTIVGNGALREDLEDQSARLGLANSVDFKGALYGRDLDRQYRKCKALVLPSKSVKHDAATEALGLVLIEAAMHGKALIGTNIGGIPEIIKDGINGFLVPQNNPQELARAIIKLLTNEDLRERMGARAFEIADAEFSWKAATERLLDAYSK